ncbi:hypothetical protein M2132_001606 [Dysgonomonas sp. PH5-45]|uniref:hypothetical protein n=1 Tax=unclassified Dysgonomonas TaxID=2630389 RepID=UPI00247692B2|nr:MULTISPECIES: hypothetical protein [unclassified Dysgonomonas]MDH6355267.1 hypothetical protein [Dysgonomonas sp. PH5-45]MDH6388207.1 hypothetical protein [Dysgonomonas sp. PH5-37]
MKRKKKNNKKRTINIDDYIKAVKKADREIQLEQSAGWVAVNKIHKSKKVYSRKNLKKDYLNE